MINENRIKEFNDGYKVGQEDMRKKVREAIDKHLKCECKSFDIYECPKHRINRDLNL